MNDQSMNTKKYTVYGEERGSRSIKIVAKDDFLLRERETMNINNGRSD